MRTLYPVALAALGVSCHLDKLLNGGGGNGPPSEAAPARVAFSSSLGNARAGQPISPPVQVTVQDSAGRVTLRDTLVTLSLAANPSGDSLRGKKQVRSVNGVATFAELRLDKADSGYTLTAAAPNLHPDTSAAFSVMPAPATVLAFTGQPSVTTQDSAMKPVRVTAYDSLGNTATNLAGSIGLALEPASNGGTLSGGTPINAVNGIATFPSLSVDKASTGYTLRATASGLTDATSSAFNITPPPNQSPVAAFTSSCPTLTCSFTDQSSDPNGSVTSWQWTFGDGTTGSTAQNPSHTYSAAGSYTVTLTVKDNQNASSSPVSHTVQVTAPNQPPSAAFTFSCTGLGCSFTDQSSDPDGSVTSWQWTFGDGTTGSTAQNPSHTYSAAGSYTVTLTVKDNQNASSSPVSHTVQVTAPNQPPTAAFTSSCTGLGCSFTDQSSDPDGSVTSWQWTFGDGTTGSTAQNPSHTYSAAGSYTVTLTVKDNQNASSSPVSHTVQVNAPNQPPTAAFTFNCTGLGCSFSDQSSDPDGSVTSWQWTFGDGTTGSTAQNPSHTYSAAGSYTVTLTVKDNQNASSSPVSHTVQVTAPNQPPSAAFTSSCPTLACSFTDQSSDPDGSVTSWQWTFGDGTTGSTAQNPSHTYSAAGSYTVTLTVKDNQNASSSPVSHTVQVTAPNQPPSAAFTSSCNGLACSFSDQSSDPDGSVTSWQWTFGD